MTFRIQKLQYYNDWKKKLFLSYKLSATMINKLLKRLLLYMSYNKWRFRLLIFIKVVFNEIDYT